MSNVGSVSSGDTRVFVSYAASDEEVAQSIVEGLEARGFGAWFMRRDVPAGSTYTVGIDAAMRGAQAMILLYSASAAESKGCAREVGMADEFDLPVIPVRLDDTPISGGFRYRLANVQWLDWRAPSVFDRLLAALPSLGTVAGNLSGDTGGRWRRDKTPVEHGALIGRHEECSLIEATITRASESGRGRLLLVEGASGVGKSVLSRFALSRASASGFLVASTVCEPFHEGMSFFPIRELMRQITTSGSPRQDIDAMYGSRSVEASMANLVDAQSIDPAARRDALLATFANLVIGVARGATPPGLLMVVDDMERADPGTVDSLLCLLARADEAPTVVVGTYRNDDPEVRVRHHLMPLARAANRAPENAVSLVLHPIRRDQMRGLAAAILGGPVELSTTFIDHLWQETEGNPLFCRELLRALQDQRSEGGATLQLRDGVWRLNGDLIGWQTPPSVEDAIRSRLELVDVELRRELERASVIGKRFAFDLMAQIAESDESDLLDLLERCVDLALIQEAGGNDDAFEFTHGKIRDVLYESITRVRRRRLHSVVADALVGMRDVVKGDWEALIGEHLYRSARYGEAAPYLIEAARNLLRLSSSAEASRLLDQALTAHREARTPASDLTAIRLLHVTALVAANEYQRALSLAVEASSDVSVDRASQGWFTDIIGDIHLILGRRDDALIAYRTAEAIAIAESDRVLELEACADMAELFERAAEQLAGLDDDEEARLRALGDAYLDRQMLLAGKFGGQEAKARALRNEAKRLRRLGDITGSLLRFEEALALVDPRVATHTLLISYAKTLRFADRLLEAVDVVNRVLAWSAQAGARRSLGIALHYRAMLTMESEGAIEAAQVDLSNALEVHGEISYERGRWEVTTLLGEWHAMRGEREAAIRRFREVVPGGWPSDIGTGIELIARQLDGIAEHGRAARLRAAWVRA